MEPLIIESSKDSPRIEFYPDRGQFLFAEKSLFEDALIFYQPIIKWLEEYKKNPFHHSNFDFRMEYFNTISAKQIFQILNTISDIAKVSKVKIRWYYREIDEDMKAKGEEYAAMLPLNFELIMTKDKNDTPE